jgi:hypothetical protein
VDVATAASTPAGSAYVGPFEKRNLRPRMMSIGFVSTSLIILLRSAGSTKARTVQCTGWTTSITISMRMGSLAPFEGASRVDGTIVVVSILATLAVSNVLPKPVDRINILPPFLVSLVYLVFLVSLVCKPDKPEKPKKPNKPFLEQPRVSGLFYATRFRPPLLDA